MSLLSHRGIAASVSLFVFLGAEWTTTADASVPIFTQAASLQVSEIPTSRSKVDPGALQKKAILENLPLSFEMNSGQFDPQVKFLVRGQGQSSFLTADGLVLVLDNRGLSDSARAVIRIELEDRIGGSKFEGVDRLAARTNYFYGGRRSADITNVANFARVQQTDVYPGIDIVYYGNDRRLEYDFMVAPGVDVKKIKLRLSGHDAANGGESGDIVLTTSAGDLALKKPVAYQERGGQRVDVPAKYVLEGNQVGFEIAAYDSGLPLVIDPIVSYSTYLGGTSVDDVPAIAVDSGGNTYIAGTTYSADFPTLNALQSTLAGPRDAFVVKLNANGSGLVYSTYLGGSRGSSYGRGIAIDSAGNAYVHGETTSASFPTTRGAYQTSFRSAGARFVSKLGSNGNALVYSTFVNGLALAVGGNGDIFAHPIAVDAGGSVLISGVGTSGFSTTPGAFQTTLKGLSDAAIVKLNATGTAAVFATFLGGSADEHGVATAADAPGNVYVTGYTKSSDFPLANAFQSARKGSQDAFVTKFSPGGALIYSTLLGGSGNDSGEAIAVDASGNAFVAGNTTSADFPILRAFQSTMPTAAQTIFITKLGPSGNALVYSSFYGGPGCFTPGPPCFSQPGHAYASGIAVDGAGNAYITGYTSFTAWPQADSIITNLPTNDGRTISFVAKVQELSSAKLSYSTIFGSTSPTGDAIALAIAVDANANTYVTGFVDGPVPTTAGAFQQGRKGPAGQDTIFVFKIAPGRFTTRLSSSHPAPTNTDVITVSAAVTNTAPGGTVTFSDNGGILATVPVSNGGATLTRSFPAGVHVLTAVYSGDNKVSQPMFLPVKQTLLGN